MKPRSSGLTWAASILMAAAALGGCNDSGQLTFNERVDIGVDIVIDQYPEARLYEAQGQASKGYTNDPDAVDKLVLVFQNANNTSVVIAETSVGTFGAPEFVNEPWLEDVVIDWPVKMDLHEANRLKERAGYTAPFDDVVLRSPLGPGANGPYFIFNSPKGWFVFVDTVTGEVTETW